MSPMKAILTLGLVAGLLAGAARHVHAAQECNALATLAGDLDPGHAATGLGARYELPSDDASVKICADALKADPGNRRLKLLTARLLLHRDYVSVEGRTLLTEAMAEGSLDAYREAAAVAGSRDDQIRLLTKPAEAGSLAVILELAELYFPAEQLKLRHNGRYLPFDKEMTSRSLAEISKAREWLARGVELGDADAAIRLARMWDAGVGGQTDEMRARRLLERAGTRYARYLLAEMKRLGKGGPVDLEGARADYQASANDGQIDPIDELGAMLEEGIGGPADPARARKLYEDSLEFCHGNIANRLAMMLMEGRGGAVDKARAGEMHIRAITCHVPAVETPVIRSNPGRIDGETWRFIQKELAKRGFYNGPVDGIHGQRTISAVNALWADEVR